jgi:hypothetical protein
VDFSAPPVCSTRTSSHILSFLQSYFEHEQQIDNGDNKQ